MWICSHEGIYANAYADTVAKASLGRETSPLARTVAERRATLVTYTATNGRGESSWVLGEGRLAEIAGEGIRRTITAELVEALEGRRLIARIRGREELWPWRTCWTQVLARSGMEGGSGGSAGEPTRTGAVMKMRAGYLGVRADYED